MKGKLQKRTSQNNYLNVKMVTKLKTNKVVGKVNNCCYEYD